MKTDKPPRQTIRTLIRKAILARYDRIAHIDNAGNIRAQGLQGMHVGDWRTVRTDAGSIRLLHRDSVFFTFGPDT